MYAPEQRREGGRGCRRSVAANCVAPVREKEKEDREGGREREE
jgi:hypothetical protein